LFIARQAAAAAQGKSFGWLGHAAGRQAQVCLRLRNGYTADMASNGRRYGAMTGSFLFRTRGVNARSQQNAMRRG
jgi:hypothetical protein